MKAFASWIDGPFRQGTQEQYADRALAEARAILAETERAPHEGDGCLCTGHARLYPVPNVAWVNREGHPYLALADALRAFVEE